MPPYCLYTGLARTIHIGCRYSVFAGNSPNRYTVICGVYIQFWPTLLVQQKIASCRFVSMVFIYHGKALTECFIHDALCCASILQITATTIAQKPMHMHMLFLPVLNGCCRTVTAVHRHCCAPSLLCTVTAVHRHCCAPSLLCTITTVHHHCCAPSLQCIVTTVHSHCCAPSLQCIVTAVHHHCCAPSYMLMGKVVLIMHHPPLLARHFQRPELSHPFPNHTPPFWDLILVLKS